MTTDLFRTPLALAPAFALLLGFSLFLPLIEIFCYPVWVAGVASGAAMLGWILFGTGVPNRASLPVLIVLFLAWGGGIIRISHVLMEPENIPSRIESTGTVLYTRTWGFDDIALVRSEIAGEGAYVLKGRAVGALRGGEVVAFSGASEKFERAKAIGEFDEFFYWRAKGARCAVTDPKIRKVGESRGFAYWRHLLEARIKATLPPQTAGYISAMVTGMRDSRLESLHRSVGTSHLLAVSGFHVGVVFAICWLVLRKLPFRLPLIGAAIWAYALFSGASPSALRAAFMLQIALLGQMIGRGGNAFNSVSAAGAMLLLFNPWMFWDVGWRLSMLAVLVLAAVVHVARGGGARSAISGAAVWLVTSAQGAWVFEKQPLAGALINFLALPVFSVLFPIALLFSLPALLGLPGGHILTMVCEILFSMWENLSRNFLLLCPWQVAFSVPLLLLAVGVFIYFCARASGFPKLRATTAAFLAVSGIAAFSYFG